MTENSDEKTFVRLEVEALFPGFSNDDGEELVRMVTARIKDELRITFHATEVKIKETTA